VVLVGDAAGHNDPIIGQGLSIALRDVRLVGEAILAGGRDQAAFRHYVEERLERLLRLRITASLVAAPRAEYGEEARLRRQRAGRRSSQTSSKRRRGRCGPLPALLAVGWAAQALV
jgi:2-polyprenyl-6-methoxyphenol hydroxylase-like FAD-dependent oxidoreductase